MEFKSTGYIEQVKDGIAYVRGLSDVGFNEVVSIETSQGSLKGLVLNLEDSVVGVVILGDYTEVTEGNSVYATGELLTLNVNEKYFGHVIDPLGNLLDSTEQIEGGESMLMEKIAPGVIERQDVNRPLATGIKAVDSMIPIGKGQRELIIGDRQTGKTAIAVDAIINQKGKDVFCIYVSIGQKTSKVAQLRSKLEQLGAMDYTVIVSANASDPASLQYIAPYAGTAIGEYIAEHGKDALIIYDDLTKHAWAYRELSLLLRRPPGREAYPGDVFYLHSRLLERAVQYSEKEGGGSLTALPIIETQAGDISAYIPTNVISITDGQIYLESDLFNAGQRPAVNIGLSVSRVGGAAQIKSMKQVAGQLRLDLAQYRELAAFAQFGSDLDKDTQARLDRGKRLYELLKQEQYDPIRTGEQVMILYAGTRGFLDKIDSHKVREWEKSFREFLSSHYEKLLETLESNSSIEGKIEDEMKTVIEKFNESFTS